jgi:uncharacterized coiled-coil protein SlyX
MSYDDIQSTFDTIESQRQRITKLEAKVAELEERNANQAAEIEKLRRQLETRTAERDEAREALRAVREFAQEIDTDVLFDGSLVEVLQAEWDALKAKIEEQSAELGRWRGDEQPHPLGQWWMNKAAAEVEPLIAKMTEYGGEGRAFDLIDIGQALIDANVNFPGTFGVGQVQELGIYFYLVGKFARWKAAVSEGRSVSDDTLLDIGIYVRMAQRIREVGGWPS